MSAAASYLVVRAGTRRVGLALPQVVEVTEPGIAHAVPSVEPAMRGVARIRGRLMPVIHLGTLLDGGCCPAVTGATAVIVACDGRRLCLEVDDAEAVLHDEALPVPPGTALPLAVAVARGADGLVPLLDLTALATRFGEGGRPE